MRVVPRVVPNRGDLGGTFANSSQRWSHREGWLLVLEGEQGAWGQGECSPLPGFSGEAPGVSGAALAGLSPLELDLQDPLSGLPELPPAARCALECAALDLAGRVSGVAVSELLGGGRPRALSALLDAPPGPALIAQAQAALGQGYAALKWKAGRPGRWEDELRAITLLRRALGPETRIRLDINRGWTRAEAEARLDALAPLGLELVEEPCAPPFPATPVPLGADESLMEPDGLDRAGPSVAALVLKPMALGGAGACLALAREAEARGLGVMVSHLLDGPVALAFAAEIAVALPGAVWACGLAPHLGLRAWPAVQIPQLHGGIARAAGSGLGLPRLDLLTQGQL